jgi:trehalose-6-phosphate synthase
VHYQEVNRKFAAALLDEMEGVEFPLVLIQDYHFALLPAYVKEARPDARVAIFWHIPWPNFEAFGICPWQHDILAGMLGADLIGFHTQYHCNNFLETVERVVEARIDWEHFTVTRGPRVTRVKPFPISVAPDVVEDMAPVSWRSSTYPWSSSGWGWNGWITPRGSSSAFTPSGASSIVIRSTGAA